MLDGDGFPKAHEVFEGNRQDRATVEEMLESLQKRVGSNPPDHAIVLSVDEKSQIQALNRTQPVLPMGLGYVEGVTHDYARNSTTTLFAALDIASGTVLTECRPRHRYQEFIELVSKTFP